MAKITRVFQKLFGADGTASYFGKFGSKAAASPVNTKDPTTIQDLQAFRDGWESAIISGSEPAIEDMNSLFLLAFYQLAYGFQEGIPEYDSSTEYYQYSIVKKTGTYELYGSLIDTNSGNALPSQTDNAYWQYLGDLADLKNSSRKFMVGQRIELDYEPSSGDMSDNMLLHADGSAVSRTTYADLFSKIGVIHGSGDGSTTFNLPDWRGRFPRGWDNGAGVDPNAASRIADATGGITGDEVGSVQDDELEEHQHYVSNSDASSSDVSSSNTLSQSRNYGNDYSYGLGGSASDADSGKSELVGGDETRPKNKYTWVGIAY